VSVSEDSADGAFNWGGAPEIMPSRDKWEGLRRAFARFAAFVLHALVLAFFVLGPVFKAPPVEPPVIPIDLVLEAPPKKAERPPRARPEPAPQPQPKASPQPQPDVPHLESGGSPELTSGAPAAPKAAAAPAEAQPEQKPAPAQPAPSEAPAAPAAQAPAPALQPVEPLPPEPPAEALSGAKPPPPTAAKGQAARVPPAAPASANTPPQVASLPPTRAAPRPPAAAPAGPATSELSAPKWSDSERRGEGGGDRYLNALRDAIMGNLIYPASAHGLTGIAKYEIVMNRQGVMLKVALVQTTGIPALDRAGMDAIENTMPFQPLPLRIVGKQVFILATLYIGP
jgi:outer membrane biosynthesis protein TonB